MIRFIYSSSLFWLVSWWNDRQHTHTHVHMYTHSRGLPFFGKLAKKKKTYRHWENLWNPAQTVLRDPDWILDWFLVSGALRHECFLCFSTMHPTRVDFGRNQVTVSLIQLQKMNCAVFITSLHPSILSKQGHWSKTWIYLDQKKKKKNGIPLSLPVCLVGANVAHRFPSLPHFP